MSETTIETGVGPCCQLDEEARPILLRWWTETRGSKVYVCGERIAGSFTCPKCNYEWPLTECVEEWTHKGKRTKEGLAIMEACGWGLGGGECPDCQLAVIQGFDKAYVIDLNSSQP